MPCNICLVSMWNIIMRTPSIQDSILLEIKPVKPVFFVYSLQAINAGFFFLQNIVFDGKLYSCYHQICDFEWSAKIMKTVHAAPRVWCFTKWKHLNDRMTLLHDDVIKWKHFPRYWPFVRGVYRSPVNSPNKGQWRGALMFFFICVSKLPWGWWFETLSRPLWHHCNVDI